MRHFRLLDQSCSTFFPEESKRAELVDLYFYQGFSIAQISEITKISSFHIRQILDEAVIVESRCVLGLKLEGKDKKRYKEVRKWRKKSSVKNFVIHPRGYPLSRRRPGLKFKINEYLKELEKELEGET